MEHETMSPTAAPAANSWTLGRLLIVLGSLAALLANVWHNAFFTAGFDPFSLAVWAVGGVFALLLVFLNRPWVHLTAGITVSILPLMVLFLFGAVTDLGDTSVGWDYGATLFLILALLLALPAGILGFVRGRKGKAQPTAGGGWGSAQGLYALALSALLLGGVAVSTVATLEAQSEPQGGGYDFDVASTVNVVTEDEEFDPQEIHVPAGEIVEIVVENKDAIFHTFTYENGDEEYSHDLIGGATTSFLAMFEEPGEYRLRCKPHSSSYTSGMIGTIVVDAPPDLEP